MAGSSIIDSVTRPAPIQVNMPPPRRGGGKPKKKTVTLAPVKSPTLTAAGFRRSTILQLAKVPTAQSIARRIVCVKGRRREARDGGGV